MESIYSSNHGRKGCRNLRIGCVCVVFLPVHYVGADGGMKGIFYLAGSAAELDRHRALPHAVHAKTVGCEPARKLLNIRWRSAKSVAELIGRKPCVEVWRGSVLLPGDETLKRGCRNGIRASESHRQAARQILARLPRMAFARSIRQPIWRFSSGYSKAYGLARIPRFSREPRGARRDVYRVQRHCRPSKRCLSYRHPLLRSERGETLRKRIRSANSCSLCARGCWNKYSP